MFESIWNPQLYYTCVWPNTHTTTINFFFVRILSILPTSVWCPYVLLSDFFSRASKQKTFGLWKVGRRLLPLHTISKQAGSRHMVGAGGRAQGGRGSIVKEDLLSCSRALVFLLDVCVCVYSSGFEKNNHRPNDDTTGSFFLLLLLVELNGSVGERVLGFKRSLCNLNLLKKQTGAVQFKWNKKWTN